jgi:hypothetical protein
VEPQQLSAAIAHPDFYREAAETIRQHLTRLEVLEKELLNAYALWDELDSRTRSQ